MGCDRTGCDALRCETTKQRQNNNRGTYARRTLATSSSALLLGWGVPVLPVLPKGPGNIATLTARGGSPLYATGKDSRRSRWTIALIRLLRRYLTTYVRTPSVRGTKPEVPYLPTYSRCVEVHTCMHMYVLCDGKMNNGNGIEF